MSSSVCQGLQSCLEPRLVESSRFLRLKLTPPNPNFSAPHPPDPLEPALPPPPSSIQQNATNNPIPNDCNMGGWSFLHSLPNKATDSAHNSDKEVVYVHPLVKRSASMLNEKSLEMCTESLGSETGSEVSSEVSSDVDVPSPPLEVCCSSSSSSSSSKAKEKCLVTRKMGRSNSFPPPLTSISGSNGVQVRSHREGGRLVLQAVSIPTCHSYFHAERSEGRLRLSLLKDATPISHRHDDDDEEDNSQELEEEEEEEDVIVEEYDDDGDDEPEENGEVEDMEGNNGNVGDEIGKAKLGSRPSTSSSTSRRGCKESGRATMVCLIGSHVGLLLNA